MQYSHHNILSPVQTNPEIWRERGRESERERERERERARYVTAYFSYMNRLPVNTKPVHVNPLIILLPIRGKKICRFKNSWIRVYNNSFHNIKK